VAIAQLTHKAARSTYNGAIQVARIAAGLADAPGATPGGLSYWAAAHDAVHHGLDAGAATFGTSIDVMLRRILHRGDRS
jgi:hypothetical protein